MAVLEVVSGHLKDHAAVTSYQPADIPAFLPANGSQQHQPPEPIAALH